MQPTSRIARSYFALLSAIVLLSQIPLVSDAQRPWPTTTGPLDIMISRPSIWTLAQAHYLLAQMHKDDRALKLKALGDLDPNAINRRRIEVLQTLLGITGEFDQTAKVKNDILQQRNETNVARTQTVQAELDRRNNDLIQTDRDLYFITVDLNRLKAATPPDADAIKAKTAEQEAKNVEKQAILDRITALNSEATRLQSENVNTNLPGLTGPFSGPQPTPSPLASKLNNLIDNTFLTNLYKDAINSSSALQASAQLDNYIQGQYELIAKQLTLLRDEVGPNERVIFLELPTAIYSVPKRGDDYVAQVRWEVTEYCSAERGGTSSPCGNHSSSATPAPTQTPDTTRESEARDESQTSYEANARVVAQKFRVEPEPTPTPASALPENCWHPVTPDTVRTVDIVPRQSALNVNSIHETSNGLAIAARFMAIFGFGAKVDYQRQREVYDQFVYQDIFASGFGKGSNLFGWTFGALPGTKSLAPGVRTTFAVLVIPDAAKRIEIVGKGYAYRRSENQPNRGETAVATDCFQLDVPDEYSSGFHVDSADYAPVQSGKRVSLVLGGRYFNPQVGVLVNGIPLQRAVAIAPIDPLSNSSAATTNSGVTGEYEYVNSQRLIASFSMANDYEGSPVIALVTPGKTSIINRYHLRVNNTSVRDDSLAAHALTEPMFMLPLAITRIDFTGREFDCTDPIDRRRQAVCLAAIMTGRGFRPNAVVTVNGEDAWITTQLSTHRYEITFRRPSGASWDFTIHQSTGQGQEETTFSLNRPLAPQVTYDILRYSAGENRTPAQMDLRLTASGFQNISSVQLLQDGTLTTPFNCRRQPDLTGPDDTATPRTRRRQRTAPQLQVSCTSVGGGDVLISMRLPHTDRNETLVLVATGDQGDSAVLNILPPAAPTITNIVNDATKKAEGSTEGGYSVVIRGANLEQVERVFFGNKPAVIQQSATGVITVQVPKAEEGSVRVILETNTLYKNKFLTNSEDFASPTETRAIFTYVKPKS